MKTFIASCQEARENRIFIAVDRRNVTIVVAVFLANTGTTVRNHKIDAAELCACGLIGQIRNRRPGEALIFNEGSRLSLKLDEKGAPVFWYDLQINGKTESCLLACEERSFVELAAFLESNALMDGQLGTPAFGLASEA